MEKGEVDQLHRLLRGSDDPSELDSLLQLVCASAETGAPRVEIVTLHEGGSSAPVAPVIADEPSTAPSAALAAAAVPSTAPSTALATTLTAAAPSSAHSIALTTAAAPSDAHATVSSAALVPAARAALVAAAATAKAAAAAGAVGKTAKAKACSTAVCQALRDALQSVPDPHEILDAVNCPRAVSTARRTYHELVTGRPPISARAPLLATEGAPWPSDQPAPPGDYGLWALGLKGSDPVENALAQFISRYAAQAIVRCLHRSDAPLVLFKPAQGDHQHRLCLLMCVTSYSNKITS